MQESFLSTVDFQKQLLKQTFQCERGRDRTRSKMWYSWMPGLTSIRVLITHWIMHAPHS